MNDSENKELKPTQVIVRPSYEPSWSVGIIFIRLSITIILALIMFTDINEGTNFLDLYLYFVHLSFLRQ